MQPPPKKHHVQTAPPQPPSGGPDINIPPPNSAPPAAPDVAPLTQVPARPPPPEAVPLSMAPTQLVIALVLVVVWAGLLLFVRRLQIQSLVAQFADLGRSRAAGTTLYMFLLVLGATAIVCALGGFWPVLAIMIPAAVLNVVLLVIFLVSLGSARASRQRR